MPDHAGVHIPPPLIFVAAFLSGLLAPRLFPVLRLPCARCRDAALPLLTVSAVLAILSFVWFLRLRTTVLPHKPSSALITSGPYHYSRNPLYVSSALLYAGLTLRLGALGALLMLPAALFAIDRYAIAREERYLERKFGREYLDYKSHVRRWL